MNGKAKFLKIRNASLMRTVENLEHNRNALEECGRFCEFEEICDRINESLSEVKAIRTAIDDKISELEAS
jgi:NADPH-dependent glutamate synthase beta subunit-like oxidoreductase